MLYKSDSIFPVIDKEMKEIGKKDLVLDIGTSSRFAKEMRYFQHHFKDNYFAFGYNPIYYPNGKSCDLSCDLEQIPVKDNSVDAVICLEVLEHVISPENGVQEIRRILKPKGKVILTTPFLLPFHGKGDDINNGGHDFYPDFRRFTHQGLQLLFNDFSKVTVIPFTNSIEYIIYNFLGGSKIPILNSAPVKKWFANVQKKKLGCATYRHLVLAEK